jgi:hypothetical protein
VAAATASIVTHLNVVVMGYDGVGGGVTMK